VPSGSLSLVKYPPKDLFACSFFFLSVKNSNVYFVSFASFKFWCNFFYFCSNSLFCLILYYYESLVIPMFTQSPTMMGQTLLVAVIYFSDSFHYEGHYPQSTTWKMPGKGSNNSRGLKMISSQNENFALKLDAGNQN
jgi:hypothetical protein